MPTKEQPAYSELVNFLTSGPTREQIVAFSESLETRRRVRYLLNAHVSGMLTPDERAELEEFNKIENFLKQLKIRARRQLPQD